MIGFEYHGKSTEDIIGTPLLLVSYDGIDGLGISRSKIEGERTISRFITNEYGTVYEPLSFSYALIKDPTYGQETFTDEEHEAINSWLLSYKLSSELRITNCGQYEYSYLGNFTSVEWQLGSGGYVICCFTFEVNGPYAFQHHEELVWDAEEDGAEGEFTITCYTSEKEEYVYPIIKAQCINFDDDSSFTLTAISDGGQELSVTTQQIIGVAVDCQRCRAYTYVNTIEDEQQVEREVSQLRFRDLGWEDVDRVYWPRLLPGENRFLITGNVRMIISYDAPYMKVGGWLI